MNTKRLRRSRIIGQGGAPLVFILVMCLGSCIIADTVTVPVSDPRAQAAIEHWKEKALAYQAHIQAQRKRKLQAEADERTLRGVPAIGNVGPCGNSWWINSQQSLRRVVEVCNALFRGYSQAAQALGAPGFRLQSCTTKLWYKQHQGMLNTWAVLYHADQLGPDPGHDGKAREAWPWEHEAWQSCRDGKYARLRGW